MSRLASRLRCGLLTLAALSATVPGAVSAAGPAALPAVAAASQAAWQAVDADRFMALTSELRCLVCQNESLADSHAPLAEDLKREIRARMAAGDSDAQILDFLVQRYGDFVTYRPPLDARTGLLWVGPLLLLGLGAGVLWRQSRRAPGGPGERAETADATDGESR